MRDALLSRKVLVWLGKSLPHGYQDCMAGDGIERCNGVFPDLPFLHDTWLILAFFDSTGWSEALTDHRWCLWAPSWASMDGRNEGMAYTMPEIPSDTALYLILPSTPLLFLSFSALLDEVPASVLTCMTPGTSQSSPTYLTIRVGKMIASAGNRSTQY
jgi:hypothetical protein